MQTGASLAQPTGMRSEVHVAIIGLLGVFTGCSETIRHHTLPPSNLGSDATTEVVERSGDADIVETEVTSVDHVRGLLEGAGLGLLIGGGIGVVSGYAQGNDPCDGVCILAFSAGDKAVLEGIVLGGIGGAVGAVFGGIIGHRVTETYTAAVPRVTVAPNHDGLTASATWRF